MPSRRTNRPEPTGKRDSTGENHHHQRRLCEPPQHRCLSPSDRDAITLLVRSFLTHAHDLDLGGDEPLSTALSRSRRKRCNSSAEKRLPCTKARTSGAAWPSQNSAAASLSRRSSNSSRVVAAR